MIESLFFLNIRHKKAVTAQKLLRLQRNEHCVLFFNGHEAVVN
nr:MAG TPA: hypothetical protein [Caudoviricetes sp.]